MTYAIYKYYAPHTGLTKSKKIRSGLTEEQAKELCSQDSCSLAANDHRFFYGYEEEK